MLMYVLLSLNDIFMIVKYTMYVGMYVCELF